MTMARTNQLSPLILPFLDQPAPAPYYSLNRLYASAYLKPTCSPMRARQAGRWTSASSSDTWDL